MRLRILLPLLFVLSALAAITVRGGKDSSQPITYPPAERGAQVDTYHGVEVPDPYRWLEDLESPETLAWMKAQEAVLASFVEEDRVARLESLIKRLGKTGVTASVPVRAGDRYFQTLRDPEQLHAIVVARKGLEGKPVTLFDPHSTFSETERFGGFSVSPRGTFLAILTTELGSRWGEIEVLDTQSGKVVDGPIEGLSSPALVWKQDESGFFFVRFGDNERLKKGGEARAELRYHPISEKPAGKQAERQTAERSRQGDGEQVLLSGPADQPSWILNPTLSSDGRFLVVGVFEGSTTQNRVLYADLQAAGAAAGSFDFVELLGDGENIFQVLDSRGDRFFAYTNHQAPNGRIVAVDRRRPQPSSWTEVVPAAEEVLAGGSSAGGNAMTLAGERLVLLYRRANVALIRVFDLAGRLEHELPLSAGWIGSGLVGDPAAPDEVWYSFNGFVEPSTVYRLDLARGESRPFFQPNLPIEPADYVLDHVFYESPDKTRVPLFVAHKRGLKRDGTHPVFMYGYGFGGWVAVPWYQPHMLAWLEMGGIYVLPGVRGGGEYGDAWRDAGVRLNRQNAIDDYIAAAEYLVEQRYTSKGGVVANGWSASGSLAAAAVLQRPDLFGAGLIGIPSLDMLRYQHFTAFKGWTRGYGSSDNSEEFRVLRRYSPYHNIREDHCYPPILVTVGEHDETTPPMHGYKFVAALQNQKDCPGPSLLKIVRGAGHAFGTTPESWRRTYAEELGFLTQVLDVEVTQASAAPSGPAE